MIRRRLLSEKPYYGELHLKKDEKTMQNLIFCLKAIRLYKFSRFDKVYSNFKKWILRDNKLMKQSTIELKQ